VLTATSTVWFVLGAAGLAAALLLLAVALCRAAAAGDAITAPPSAMRSPELRVVGTCSECGGELLLTVADRQVTCPCGAASFALPPHRSRDPLERQYHSPTVPHPWEASS
jgi:hypothetical protein